jgi:hypothetical protein
MHEGLKRFEAFKNETKKLGGRFGQVYGRQKTIPRSCVNLTPQFFNVRFAVYSGRMDIARSVKT